MSRQQRYMRIISGEARGARASFARAALALASPIYGAAVRLRNASYDRGWRRRSKLSRPVISVGNITVGGTGKTPIVAWVCGSLRDMGLRPAVLMRGYKAQPGSKGDEQSLLESLLAGVPVEADPDRAAGARRVLQQNPDVNVFVLDDAFQHRRIRREIDLVLVDATRAFGYGRLLPRGLLREQVTSLARADALVLTRSALVPAPRLSEIRAAISAQSQAPIYECNLLPAGFVDESGSATGFLPATSVVAVCGIGNPGAYLADLGSAGLSVARSLIFDDHHAFTERDLARISAAVAETGAPVVTTAKDWVKLRSLRPQGGGPQIFVSRQRVEFAGGDAQRLLQQIKASVAK